MTKKIRQIIWALKAEKSIDAILDYVYEHFDEFKLIICKSEGTCYENFVHNMVEIEVAETFEFIKSLKKQGYDVPDMEKAVCHMIASGMFTGIFELIEHDMKKENAKNMRLHFWIFTSQVGRKF